MTISVPSFAAARTEFTDLTNPVILFCARQVLPLAWRMPVFCKAILVSLALLVISSTSAAPLRIGMDLDGEPMTFIDSKGVPRGFAVEIVTTIAQEMNLEVVFVAKPWPEMFEDFKAGRVDGLANVTYTKDRAQIIEFTDPQIVMKSAIFVRKGDHSISRASDLRDLVVALKPGGAPHAYLEAHGWAQHVLPTGTLRDSLRAVSEGRADAVLDASIIGYKTVRDEHLSNIETANVELVDFAQRLHIGFHSGDIAHVALFNDGLARLHTNGKYDRIYERWIGPLEPGRLRFRDVQPYLPAAALLAIAIVLAFVWQRRLLRQLAKQTEALRVSITDLKRAEEEKEKLQRKMLEAQKLESLGVLAGGIAHDFNNLLTVVLANASLARSATMAEERDAELAHIETAARRAADLCRQMLAYAGRGSFVATRLDLGRLVRDTTHLLQVSISKKAHLALNLATSLPPVEADASQLQQVIMNLVINASEALGENNGEIHLTTRCARLEAAAGEIVHSFDLPEVECVCLEVADTGQGMEAATLARIFDPFFTTKFTGRGLGLAAVLGIVRSCGGALTVRSTPGSGTVFRLYLPVAKGEAALSSYSTPPFPVNSAVPAGGVGTILIADDEPVVLSTAAAMIRREGYTAVLASDGQQALDHFHANPDGFTAVLLDLTMPGLNGAEVLQEIRRVRPASRVIVMSGFSEQDVLKRLEGLHPAAILHKPFTMQTLLARLREQ